DEIQELIAIDNEQETEDDSAEPTSHFESRKKSEAEVLGKAQRIVLELNSDNIKRVLAENEYVLLLGYAPWDGRSAELMPKFAEAANLLKSLGSTLLMAKLDSERHPQAASSIGIKGLPTLLLFVNGTSQAYTGGFSSEEIVTWARKKTGMPVIRISSVAEATEFLKQHSVYAVGSFSEFEGYEYEQFYEAAVADNEIQFVETSSLEAAKALFPEAKENTAIPSFFLVKNEPEHCTSLDGILSLERILRFLEDNKLPLVNVMTDFNSAKIYSRVDKLQVYVFAVAEALNEMIIDDLREISRKFKSKILFIAVDIGNDNLAKPILSLFGLEESKGTVVVAFNYVSNSKYLLESNATPRNVEDFCSKLAEGSLHPFFKSQPVPENERSSSSGGTLSVVGKTFDELILRSTENVVLEVHTPWCIKCEAASKQIQKLAKHFEGLDGLVFARLDASLNEVPNLNVEDYPALLFFPAGNKSNPVKLPTNSNLKELASLINTYLKGRHESPGKDEL
ncbi:hypothetical protein M569_05111, partial [Genlisea aurea]